jgi:predicted DNA-binding transcriptional regulator YafY
LHKSQRLFQMMMRINAKKSFTVKELADEFGLSSRTIMRDLQELSELGVPIYSIHALESVSIDVSRYSSNPAAGHYVS